MRLFALIFSTFDKRMKKNPLIIVFSNFILAHFLHAYKNCIATQMSDHDVMSYSFSVRVKNRRLGKGNV